MKQGWEIKKLGEIGTFQRGGGFLKSDYVDDGFPCIHYGQIHTRFGVKTLSHLTCIPEQLALSKSKIAHKGDIVIAITSEDVEGSCKCTAWMGDYDVAVGGHAAIYRHNLNPAFVAYYFRGAYFQTAKTVFAHGSKVVEIKPNDIATIKIAYPSLPEQEKIVAELDCLSGIIEKKKQQLKEYDALAQSIFYEMFGNPDESQYPLQSLSSLSLSKLSYGSGASAVEYDGKVRYVRITDIMEDGKLDINAMSPNVFDDKYLLNDGDILFARSGATVGKTYHYKEADGMAIYAGYLIRFIPNRDFVIPEYIYYYTRSPYYLAFVKKNAQAVAQPNINAKQYGDLQVCVPPLTLQQEFASKIEAIEKQKELIKQSIVETETLFNSRMDYYFN